MKPAVPDAGTIIFVEGENAVIMIKGGKSARVTATEYDGCKKNHIR